MRMVVLFVKSEGFEEVIGVFESEELAQESIKLVQAKFNSPEVYENYLERGIPDPREYSYRTEGYSLNMNVLL